MLYINSHKYVYIQKYASKQARVGVCTLECVRSKGALHVNKCLRESMCWLGMRMQECVLVGNAHAGECVLVGNAHAEEYIGWECACGRMCYVSFKCSCVLVYLVV